MKQTNFVLLLLLVGIVFSCSNDDLTEISRTADYSFVKIEFLKTSQSDKKEYYMPVSAIEFLNQSGIVQTFNYVPSSEIDESSQFSGIDSMILNHIVDLQLVAVPVDITDQIELGSQKWPISNCVERKESFVTYTGSETLVQPNSKVIFQIKPFIRELKMDFKLTLINISTFQTETFAGQWTGKIPLKMDFEIVFTNL